MKSNIKRCISFFIEGIIIVATCCAIAACGASTEAEKAYGYDYNRLTITNEAYNRGTMFYIIKDNETGAEFLYAGDGCIVQIRKENNE